MTELTIIPDIHADLARLNASLAQVKDNKIAFLGDFIDARQSVKAPNDLAVLEKVKELVKTDRAMAVMGNHELNAILFHRKNKQGAPLRSHSPNNYDQHRSFIDKFGLDQFRFFLFREVPFGKDGDFSEKAIALRVNADLSNNFGNLVQRVCSFVNKNCNSDSLYYGVPAKKIKQRNLYDNYL